MPRPMHAVRPIVRAAAEVGASSRVAQRGALLAALAVALAAPAHVDRAFAADPPDLGAAFVEQQRARVATAAFVAPPLPSGAADVSAGSFVDDTPHAFLRYRVGYAGAAVATSIDTQAIAGLRWHRALLVHEVDVPGADAATSPRTRTALSLDWPETATRVTLGDVAAARPATGGDAVRLTGVAIRRASALPGDLETLAPATGSTALTGQMTVSADGEARYASALSSQALAAVVPSFAPGFAASPTAPLAALASVATGLDRAAMPMPRGGATELEYAMGSERPVTSAALSGEARDAFVASVRAGVTDALSIGAQAEGRDSRRDGALGFAVSLGSAGALRGSVGTTRDATGDGCATASVDYRVSQAGVELAAAYARGPADAAVLRSDAATAPVQSVGGRLRVALNATDSVVLASDRASSADAAPFTATRVTFRRALAPSVALDGVIGYVSGTSTAIGMVPEGWLASLNVRWSLDSGQARASP